jgi:hypothetical protein
MSDLPSNRLYELLPAIYRLRDAAQGYPLLGLTEVIATQVDVVEQDILGLYENWFIETCEDWVVPYIADLIGYSPVAAAGLRSTATTAEAVALNAALTPRREVANTIGYRRRKGTRAVLEQLAGDVGGWPAHGVEYFRRLAYDQAVNHLHPMRGRTVELRAGDALDRLGQAFDVIAHGVDIRRPASARTPGVFNIPSVAVWAWRLRAYSVTRTPAYCQQQVAPHCFSFSVLGQDAPLFTAPRPSAEPVEDLPRPARHVGEQLAVPDPIRPRQLRDHLSEYAGTEHSFAIWNGNAAEPIPADSIEVADLSDWVYRPARGQILVDPVLGRFAFHPREVPKEGAWVTYHYGFSADIGGGEYVRALRQRPGARIYRVSAGHNGRIGDALDRWRADAPDDAVIEIAGSGVFTEQLRIELAAGQSLQLRAAEGARPVIRLLDWQADRPDSLVVSGSEGSRLTLDGLLITGQAVEIQGPLDLLAIRHCTLVPGRGLDWGCQPRRPSEPSLELVDVHGCVLIEHSIVGAIQVSEDEVGSDPVEIQISDSIVDATSPSRVAIGAPPDFGCAHAILSVRRTTVIGEVGVHAIALGENTIFAGLVHVIRRGLGCLRFCYTDPLPERRTPRRYECQPDLVAADQYVRVAPRWESVRYGTPAYCRLARTCAAEITGGADDEAEMGVFHDLFEAQRQANLQARLNEYSPAAMDPGIIFAT